MNQEFWGAGEWGLQRRAFKAEGPVCAKGLEANVTVAQFSGPGLATRQVRE